MPFMNEIIEVNWTSGSIEEARKISRLLVENHLVACAQIVPWIESIYIWNHQLETTQESKIILKTVRENFDAVKQFIIENCQYEVPEVTFIRIDGGNEEYLNFVVNQCLKNNVN